MSFVAPALSTPRIGVLASTMSNLADRKDSGELLSSSISPLCTGYAEKEQSTDSDNTDEWE
jgi:hypothetical protein